MTPMYGESGSSRTPSRVIWLEEPLLRDIRELLTTTVGHVGPAFTLIDLDENGLRGAAVDAQTGQCLIELNDHTLQAPAFDRAIADYLVRIGKAQMPETAEWARELLDLMPQARLLLSTSPGTFLMGKQHVGLLRVIRADLDEALGASLVRAVSVARSVSIASPLPITAAVVMPNHTQWPGLLDALGSALSGVVPPAMPVAPLKNPLSTLRPSRHARPSDGEVEPALPPQLPTTQLPLPPPTHVPVPSLPPVSAPAALTPPPQAVPTDRRKQNRLVLVGAALLAVLIVVGGATLVTTPWRDDATQPQSQRYLTTPDPTGTSTTTTTSPTSTPVVPPINTSAALAPVVKYTTPPPPPPPTTRRPAPRPRLNTIPNPIPGQPPIVLP